MKTQNTIKNRKALVDSLVYAVESELEKYPNDTISLDRMFDPGTYDEYFTDYESMSNRQYARLRNEVIEGIETINLRNRNSLRLETITTYTELNTNKIS